MTQAAQLLARFPALSKLASWPKPMQMGLAAAIAAAVVVLLLWSRSPDYRVLFSNLEDRDGGAIITALTQMNVPYRFSENGTAILIPADRVYQARMQLAEQGLPRAGQAGFELLDHTQFGASQFTQQVTYQRALEGELVSTIEAVHSVQKARVHLAIPRESLFVRERQAPTASVLLTLYPGRSLSQPQVSAITWLVSSSVPNLTADNVSIIDQNGRLLTSPSGEAGVDGTQRNFINDLEQRTVQRILTLISPLVGAGNVRAQASADIDFSQFETTSEVYRPNQKPGEAAVRSEQSSASSHTNALPAQGIPGALTNQPPANPTADIVDPQPPKAAAGAPRANAAATRANDAIGTGGARANSTAKQDSGSSRNDATINYEVDRTISHTKAPLGKLQRMSVAVVVNYQRDKDGELAPLDASELAKLENLAREAMGFSQQRGDSLSLINSPFNEADVVSAPLWMNPLYQRMAMDAGRYLLIALLLFVLWRKILRPLVRNVEIDKAKEIDANAASAAAEKLARETEAAAEKRASEISRYEDNLNTARSMAKKDPRAVAMVLRSWMGKNGNR